MSFGFRAGDRDHDEDLMSGGPSNHGKLAGVSRSPSLARLLSVSAIVVALAVAGSLALEDVLRKEALNDDSSPVQTTENTAPKPALSETPPDTNVRNDLVRVNYLERRLALLERQIVVLQTQLTAAQQDNVKFGAKLVSLQTQLTSTSVPLERVASETGTLNGPDTPADDNASETVVAPDQRTPRSKIMAKLEAAPEKPKTRP